MTLLGASSHLLRNAAFRTFLLARLISTSGSAMAPVALAFTVLGADARPTGLAVVLAANMLPQLVLLLIGGVAADRLAPRRLLVTGHLLAAATQGCVALVAAFGGGATTAGVAGLSCLTGAATALMQPALNSTLPRLVRADQLQRANALLRLPANLVRIVAPALGGALVAVVGPQWTLGWDAASFVLAGALCARLPVGRAAHGAGGTAGETGGEETGETGGEETGKTGGEETGETGGESAPRGFAALRGDFRDGWKEFASRAWLWSYVLSGTGVVALWLGGYQLLGPVVMKDSGRGAGQWGLVQAAFASGLVLGALVALRWRPRRLMVACVCAGIPMAPPLLALAGGAHLPVLLPTAVLAGGGLDLSIVWWNTAVQQELAPEVLGRVSSYVSIGEQLALPLGYVIIGVAATLAGPTTVLVWCGVLLFLCNVVLLAVPGQWGVLRVEVPAPRTAGPTSPPADPPEPVAALPPARERGER